MPEFNAIITSDGLQLTNVVTLGSVTDTGASSTFSINPLENYLIAAEQFVIDPEYVEPLISSVTFSDSTTPFGLGNTVLCTINWVETSTSGLGSYGYLTIDLPIIFSGAAGEVAYDSLSTSLSFTYLPILNLNSANQQVYITPALGFTFDSGLVASNIVISENTEGTTSYDISCDVNGNEQVEILEITFSTTYDGGTGEGRYFWAETVNEIMAQLNESFTTSDESGEFAIELENDSSDSYGNIMTFTFVIAYTRAEGVTTDIGSTITTTTDLNEYAANFNASYNISPNGADEHQVAFNSGNIPGEFTLSIPSDASWITNGSTSTSYSLSGGVFYVDVAALGANPTRIATLALTSNAYPTIVRDTTTVQQNEANFVTLEVANLNSDGSYTIISGNSEANPAKVISSPGSMTFQDGYLANGTYFDSDEENNYNFNGGSFIEYALILTTNLSIDPADVTIENFNLQTTQDLYPLNADGDTVFPGSRWCVIDDFPTTFEDKGGGVYLKKFRVRNQDIYNNFGASIVNNPLQNKDRTASFTVTHPTGATATVFIQQDKKYTKDTTLAQHEDIQAKAALGSAAFPSYSTAPTLNATTSFNSELSTYTIKLKLLDFETDFDLKNLITTDSTSHTFNQYPLPQYTYDAGSTINWDGANGTYPEIVPNDHSFFSNYLGGAELTYNANFNEASTDTDYHYKLTFQAENNNSWGDRTMNFYFNHPENFNAPSFNSDIYDVKVTIKQTLTNLLDAFALDDSGNALPALDIGSTGIPNEFYNFSHTAGSREIGVIFNTSDGNINLPNPVTIGLWNISTSTYTPLGSNTEYNGFSYESIDASDFTIEDNNGTHYFTFTLSVTENTTLDTQRTITLGFWHPTLDPTINEPNDILAFRQYQQPFNEATMGVELYTNDSLELGTEGGTITVMINVLDYTADDFSNDTNVPEAEAWLWAGPFVGDGPYGGDVYTSLNYISYTPQLTVNKNESYATPGNLTIDGVTTDDGSNNTYTHYVQIPYNAYSSNELKHIAVRAKHGFIGAFQNDEDYIFFTLQNVSGNLNISQFAFEGNNLIGYNGFVNYALIPPLGGPGAVKIKITGENFPADRFGGGDPQNFPTAEGGVIAYKSSCLGYLNLQNYIHARFIDPDYIDFTTGVVDPTKAKVLQNPATVEDNGTHLPNGFAFTSDDGINNTNSEYIIEAPIGNPLSEGDFLPAQFFSQNYGPATGDVIVSDSSSVDPIYLGTTSFITTLQIENHSEVDTVNSIIGLWTGDSMPKTNRIDFQDFVSNSSLATYSTSTSQLENTAWVAGGASNNLSFGISDNGSGNELVYNYLHTTLGLTGDDDKRLWVYNLIETDPVNKGFSWNYHPINNVFNIDDTPNTSTSYVVLGFRFRTPSGSAYVDIGGDLQYEDVYVEFEVYDYESNNQDQLNFGVMSSGSWYNPPAYFNQFENVNFMTDQYGVINLGSDPVDQNEARKVAQDAIRIAGDGKYRTRLRIQTNTKHFRFFARQCVKFKVKNLIISSPNNEYMLDPTNNVTFDTPPQAYLYLKQQPLDTNALQFASTNQLGFPGLYGSPLGSNTDVFGLNSDIGSYDPILVGNPNFDSQDEFIPNDSPIFAGATTIPNQDVAYVAYNGYPMYIIHVQNYTSTTVVKAWDLSNNTPLLDNDMINSYVPQFAQDSGYFLLGITQNPTNEIRFIRLALYAAEPSTDTELPEDVYIMLQQANPNV